MILIFALSPRCGSTAIAEAIAESLNTHYILEPFSDKWDSWASIYNISTKPSIENIFQVCEENNIQVIKTIECHLSREKNIFLIDKCKSIFLYRKYFIDTALSEWMSYNYCNKTGVKYAYHIRDISNLQDFYTLPRDEISIDSTVKYFNTCKRIKDKYILESNVDVVLSYEEYFNKNVIKNHNNLINNLGFKILSNNFESIICEEKKHNSHDIYRKLIPNYSDLMKLKDELIL